MENIRKIKLVSKEGSKYDTTNKAVSRSVILKGQVYDDFPDFDEYETNVNENILQKIVEYLNYYGNKDEDKEPSKIEKPLKNDDFKKLVSEWEYNFLGEDLNLIFQILDGASYLDIRPLIELAAAKIAFAIKNVNTESIRKTFDIKEMTEGEKETIYRNYNVKY